jgi:predicted Zn finger-like uncharacterized protein
VEIGSMQIVCPHCTTSYAIDLATLGAAGRSVRCSRCKQVWLARPEDATEPAAAVPAMAEAGAEGAGAEAAAAWQAPARQDEAGEHETPVVDSPSISADLPAAAEGEAAPKAAAPDWPQQARHEAQDAEVAPPRRQPWLRKRVSRGAAGKPLFGLSTACAAMGALVLALMIWRLEVVRLLPQTAAFYKMVGFDVNLRGLIFKDVKISSETKDGKPVLVIEGVITGETTRPVELPRLRFSVRDAQGAEIYAWNAVLDQAVLKPGEKAWFKSRLASPPPEGRAVDVRFFSKRDIAAAGA